jgi:hypothetical protein
MRALALIESLRQHLRRTDLPARHRRRPTDFVRERKLIFPVVMLLILQKSLKSLQARLHEVFRAVSQQGRGDASSVTAGAFTHARAKLRATVFVELNQAAVLPLVYGPAHAGLVERWRGHRLLGLDSSLVRLPDRAGLRAHFGVVECSNHHGVQESYPEARVSVLFDLLNQVALDGALVASRQGETTLVAAHLPHLQPGDVVISDRGYAGYRHFAQVGAAGGHFVSRCSRGSFPAVRALFARDEAGVSQVVTLQAPAHVRAECRREGWPLELRVRLITVRLATEELEVLATSLWDEAAYPTEEFAAVYWRRWGQETFYGRLKGRLDLEHFSGETVEAVAQDFFALLLLSNVESVVSGPARWELEQVSARREQPVQVNRAVSLHALKTRLIDLLGSAVPAEQVLEELTRWFVQSPVSVRRGRGAPRRKASPSRSYHYQRRVRKLVF